MKELKMGTYLIVGADRGIGREMVRQLSDRGERVIAACLGAEPLEGENVVTVPDIDVTSDAAVEKLCVALDYEKPIDVVIHVAGVLGLDAFGKIDFGDVRRQFEINTVGPLRVAQAVEPLLAKQAKLGIVTSRVGSLADNGSGGMYAYRVSKCGANMVGLNLHHDLKDKGHSVLLLHPGMVATDLTKDMRGDLTWDTPENAAAGLIRNMDELTPETSGRFQHANGEFLPW